MKISKQNILSSGPSKCKCLKVGISMSCSRVGKKVSMVGV